MVVFLCSMAAMRDGEREEVVVVVVAMDDAPAGRSANQRTHSGGCKDKKQTQPTDAPRNFGSLSRRPPHVALKLSFAMSKHLNLPYRSLP